MEIIQLFQAMLSALMVPVVIYIVKLEKRLITLEIKITQLCQSINEKGGERK